MEDNIPHLSWRTVKSIFSIQTDRHFIFHFIVYRYPYFIMRVMLAANMHLSRQTKAKKDGTQCGLSKYSKRSHKFHTEVVKEDKSYSYFGYLISKMLQRRSEREGSFSLPSDRN